MNYTETMAKYAANLKYEDIPKETIDLVKILILDYISCAYGGVQTESGRIAAEFAREFSEKGKCTVIGYGYKSAPYNAAFANAILSHSIELDDADVLAYIHTGPQTVSPALAAAEWVNASGKDFLVGVTIGSEFVHRISEATNPSLRNRGFHSTPTCGVFGAGAAAGRIMKLSEEKMVSVLGLSGAQASGLMEMYGISMAKRFNPAPAARNGVTAALFAERGFTGAETILEGERGFLRACSDQFDLSKLTDGLGKEFPIFVEYKRYSCARPIHNAIDCALTLRREQRIDPTRVDKIIVSRHPRWANYHNIPRPRTYHEAQVSLPYAVAVSLVEGDAFFSQFSEEKLKDPLIRRLSESVEIRTIDGLPRDVSCRMEVILKDGSRHVSQVDYPKGSKENPMSPEERREKFRKLSSEVLDEKKQKGLEEIISGIENLKDVSTLLSLVVK